MAYAAKDRCASIQLSRFRALFCRGLSLFNRSQDRLKSPAQDIMRKMNVVGRVGTHSAVHLEAREWPHAVSFNALSKSGRHVQAQKAGDEECAEGLDDRT